MGKHGGVRTTKESGQGLRVMGEPLVVEVDEGGEEIDTSASTEAAAAKSAQPAATRQVSAAQVTVVAKKLEGMEVTRTEQIEALPTFEKTTGLVAVESGMTLYS